MCTEVEEKNTEAILTVMNTTELVVEIRPEKNLRCSDFSAKKTSSKIL